MRIVSGKYKSRQLEYPKDKPDLRPTKDMVKEAVFSIVQTRIVDSKFLDLFAGVGSMGLEALSRGAAEIVMIDRNPVFIYKNAQKLNCLDALRIYKNDALKALHILNKHQEKFDLIYIDPPYQSDLAEAALNKVFQLDILNQSGRIILETDLRKEIKSEDFVLDAEKFYGQTKILIYKHKENND